MALDFKRILCPVDLSRFSLDGLKLAVKVAAASKAALYVLHAIDNPFDELYMSSIAQADPALLGLYQSQPRKRAEIVAATEEHSTVLLKQFAHDWVTALSKVRYIVKSGDPLEAILDAAAERRVDLIVLATHGRTGIKRLLIGNVAEKVVRHAPCPVLIVKSRGARRRLGSSGR
jgi:nucleotide-binding universal stress UspA family protein